MNLRHLGPSEFYPPRAPRLYLRAMPQYSKSNWNYWNVQSQPPFLKLLLRGQCNLLSNNLMVTLFHADFRVAWRCTWCLIGGMATPRIRSGPLGPSTACDACGIWYSRYGILPQERYQQHLL
jgi:hypothetical protein